MQVGVGTGLSFLPLIFVHGNGLRGGKTFFKCHKMEDKNEVLHSEIISLTFSNSIRGG